MKIPDPTTPVVTIATLIDEAHQKRQEKPRPHLGCSTLGHSCDRWLWLSFRWAVVEKFPGRILRLFRRGHHEENFIVSDLRSAGVDIRDTTGAQSRVDFGTHVSGSIDGVIHSGVPGAEKGKHIAEFKTHAKKSFDAVVKEGVEKSKWMHYVQMQVYMLGSKIDRALYLAVCKDDDRIYTERVRLDKELAQKFVDRGHRIALTDRLPEPMSADPTWYECMYCPGHDFCFGSKTTKEVNCRTCANATALSDSTWHCSLWDDLIPIDAQRTGCESHVVHPDLVPWQRIDSPIEWVAKYRIGKKEVMNGEPGPDVYSSKELLANPEACGQPHNFINKMRSEFGGRLC